MKICNIEFTLEIIEITLENIEIALTFSNCFDVFDVFQIFQKVFPRIPGGCRHKESDENRVLNIVYLSFGYTYF